MTKKTEQNTEVYEKIVAGDSLIQLYMEAVEALKEANNTISQLEDDIAELQRDACYLCIRNEGVHY